MSIKTAEKLAQDIKNDRVTASAVERAVRLGWTSSSLIAYTLGVDRSTPRKWWTKGIHPGNIERSDEGLYRLVIAQPDEREVDYDDYDDDSSPSLVPLDAEVHSPLDDIDEVPIEEIIEARIKAYRRKRAKHSSTRVVEMKDALPFGVALLGDPHIDNDGCHMELLTNDVDLLSQTPGVWMTTVGDLQDNWIGRLGKLYANSSTTASTGWRLSSWLLSQGQWLAVVGGNHDAWSHVPGLDPVSWLTKDCGVRCYDSDELRLEVRWRGYENLQPFHLWMRHDFKGRSWFHPSHGPNKAAMLDDRADLLACGHTHNWAQLSQEHANGRVTHAVRVRGYKYVDKYAKEKGFYANKFGATCLAVVDPFTSGPGRVSIFWNLEQGCTFLRSLRDSRKRKM